MIKRANSYAAQHPLYSPLNEQWEGFIQHLTNQKVRQATVKTADDRLSVIWAEKLNEQACPQERLDQILTQLVQRHGYSFNSVYKKLVKNPVETSSKAIYDF